MQSLFDACPWSRCISIKESEDRRTAFRTQFEKRGMRPPTCLLVKRDDENPGRGCYTSHLECMRRALRNNQSHALVFEDDIEFAKVPRAVWEDAARFVVSHPFDVLLLGWCTGDGYRKNMCLRSDKVQGYSYLYKTKCLCTHAIVYSKAFMQDFVKNHSTYPGYEFDDVLTELPIDMYIVSPELFGQSDAPSTIDDPNMERQFTKS